MSPRSILDVSISTPFGLFCLRYPCLTHGISTISRRDLCHRRCSEPLPHYRYPLAYSLIHNHQQRWVRSPNGGIGSASSILWYLGLTAGLLTIIRKNKAKAREMRVLFL